MNFLRKLFGLKESQPEVHTSAKTKVQIPQRVKTTDELENAFQLAGLKNLFPKISPLVKHKLEITTQPAEEDQLTVCQSKIGGLPDIPALFEWPKTEEGKSLSFIAQINLSEVSMYKSTALLPKTGLLYFFYCADQEAWGFDPKDKDRFKVIYSEHITKLERANIPSDIEDQFTPNALIFNEVLSVPGAVKESVSAYLENKDIDAYCNIEMPSENQMFGYPQVIQNAMELECQLVTNGLYCGNASGYNDPRAKLLEEGAKDWILLLQIGSEDDKTGMMWGDSGKLYYWIRKQDLESKAFDKAWMIVQCY